MVGLSGIPRDDELPWLATEGSRFGVYAHRLWDALLAHEVVADR
jgi:hypothetical protein